jgi:hypothetical protein
MAELHFSTVQIRSELNGMADLAAEFLGRQDSQRLREASRSLTTALESTGVWQLPSENPLETVEAEREAGFLFGRLSFKWDVRKLTPTTFKVSGNASTTIEILNLGASAPPISWNTDIGGSGHPGHRLHMQFRADGKSTEIPRLPSILLTPVDCLDFLLGELFQEKWERHQYARHTQTAGWTSDVRRRVCHLLRTKAECAGRPSVLTPWMTLKKWDFTQPRLSLADD